MEWISTALRKDSSEVNGRYDRGREKEWMSRSLRNELSGVSAPRCGGSREDVREGERVREW
jgi:hypothetical protein